MGLWLSLGYLLRAGCMYGTVHDFPPGLNVFSDVSFFLVHVYDYLFRPVTDLTSPLQLYFHGHTFEAIITLCASLIDMLEPLVAIDSLDAISIMSKT